MSEDFFNLLNNVFELMTENQLKKDMDDTLLEKLLTFIENFKFWRSNSQDDNIVVENKENQNMHSDFIKELIQKTTALSLIKKVIFSTIAQDDYYVVPVRTFTIRFLGLILDNPEEIFPFEKILPLFKNEYGKVITNHIPSVQDALLDCLSCVTKQFKGAMWFIDRDLNDFVFASFKSSSYYVRKSAVNFFMNFISKWVTVYEIQEKIPEQLLLVNFLNDLITFISSPEQLMSDECCIFILKKLYELEITKFIIDDNTNLASSVAKCLLETTKEADLNNKLMDLFLTIHLKFTLPDNLVTSIVECLILKEKLNLAIELASSCARITWLKQCCPEEINFFSMPLNILLNIASLNSENYYTVKSDFVFNMMQEQMKEKTECKALFNSCLSALQRVIPALNSETQRNLGMKMLQLAKCSDQPHHKWLYAVLEDRLVHHSLLEFYSNLLVEDVYSSMLNDGQDLLFQNVLQFLKKPTHDSNFLSQLTLLMEKILILHNKYDYNIKETERNELIEIVVRVLHDKREPVVDSAIHLTGQIINNREWKDIIINQAIHLILWDIAICGTHDGTIRSTALKVIIESCLKGCFLNEIKSSKGITETDIAKVLFYLTNDPDFFLQREALSCLFHWTKWKWNEFQSSCKDFLYGALVSAVKSLDLELKLIALDVWLWLLENEFIFSPTVNIKEYIECLAISGFGLSMILAFEDYDLAVQYKTAGILSKIKQTLVSHGNSFESLEKSLSTKNESTQCIMTQSNSEPLSKEERDKGLDAVMELSTTEQLTNICKSSDLFDIYDFKQEYFSSDGEDKTCQVSAFWTCLWSKNVDIVLEPNKKLTDITNVKSLLNDIISAKIVECDMTENSADCY